MEPKDLLTSFCFILFHFVSFCFVLFPLRASIIGTFPVPTERSGTLLTMMGTPLEHCNFSRYSLFPRRSAPLRASIIGTFPSSNGAERNTFDNDGNIAISLGIHYFSAAPLRSLPQSLVHFPVPTERSGTLLTMFH